MKKYHLRFVVFLTLSVFASIALTTEYKSIYNARGSYYCLGPTEKHLATVYPLTHASEDQFNKISVGMTLDEVCKILDNKYLATVTQIKDSYFSEELKKNTSKCMVYDLVLNPTTTNLHLARITLMFDAKGLLIGKKFGVFEFNNTWLNGTQRLKLFIKNRLKEGMTNKDVSKIIHNAGVYPGTVTYERINGKTSEEYYYTFGPFNGGVPYDYGDVFGRYDYYGSNDWETLTLWFEDGKLTVISW